MIPAEAVEAAAMAIFQNQTGMDWESRSDVLKETVRADARAALEAAAPYMMALVETKADELVAEYRRGYRDGLADRKQVTADQRDREPGVEAGPILSIGMKAYIWVEVFGMWQDAIWDGNVWRVADNDTVENRHVSKWVIQ